MTGPYNDIIHLPHPTSAKHPRMPIQDRAAIFSPFAALTGHSAAIAETARLTDQRMELDEDTKMELDLKQQVLNNITEEHPEITVTWFRPDERKEGGAYVTTAGRLKRIDEVERALVLTDGTAIPLADVVGIEGNCFREHLKEEEERLSNRRSRGVYSVAPPGRSISAPSLIRKYLSTIPCLCSILSGKRLL